MGLDDQKRNARRPNEPDTKIIKKTGNVTGNTVDGITTGIRNKVGTAFVGESGSIAANKRVSNGNTGIVVRKDQTGMKRMEYTGNITGDHVKGSSTGITDEE
ncbi:uncharacterized protein J4E87_001332 [Alternaria ethzedia]|uniref:uncharacterized protein n=1 Tax=Alternaria ethzedia TaxID=181014 RepID=UPI0020C23B3C|nr:uncharacterized protein J4E87_001332 [Alternaria ethzedia]KAI4612052.1 hypothetical protein J4E80_007506 [Alternaria sp. BMP 0032]KAI4634162.1 hypothetical protein J4E87_001332 [Alternaria ethzedia]